MLDRLTDARCHVQVKADAPGVAADVTYAAAPFDVLLAANLFLGALIVWLGDRRDD